MPRLHRIRKNIFVLRPRGNEWANANINIIKARTPALIDVGSNFDTNTDYLMKILRSTGIEKIDKIIITHSHIDHCQNVGILAEKFGAEVIAHRNATPILKHNKQGFETFEYWELVEEAFPRIFHSRLNWFYRRLILMGYNYFVYRRTKSVDAVTTVAEGDTIDLGNIKLEVFFTPGHSDDSLCLLERKEKVLFTGDMIPWTPYIHTNIQDFENSIKKILRIADNHKIQTMVRGHQRPQGAREEVKNYQLFLQDMKIAQRRILQLLKQKSPQTAKQMLPYVFRRSHFTHQLIYRIIMRTQQFWIAKYLQNLERKKKITAIREGKKTYYYFNEN
ncbi:MAG: MBL fold metallo-hydrolase [Promethearchaeota archaeon]|nr:MAG: MBL fold metallo-hydrolase [Candidatus Lokiarchaeota archaeon]